MSSTSSLSHFGSYSWSAPRIIQDARVRAYAAASANAASPARVLRTCGKQRRHREYKLLTFIASFTHSGSGGRTMSRYPTTQDMAEDAWQGKVFRRRRRVPSAISIPSRLALNMSDNFQSTSCIYCARLHFGVEHPFNMAPLRSSSESIALARFSTMYMRIRISNTQRVACTAQQVGGPHPGIPG